MTKMFYNKKTDQWKIFVQYRRFGPVRTITVYCRCDETWTFRKVALKFPVRGELWDGFETTALTLQQFREKQWNSSNFKWQDCDSATHEDTETWGSPCQLHQSQPSEIPPRFHSLSCLLHSDTAADTCCREAVNHSTDHTVHVSQTEQVHSSEKREVISLGSRSIHSPINQFVQCVRLLFWLWLWRNAKKSSNKKKHHTQQSSNSWKVFKTHTFIFLSIHFQ